jgi:hypothetical protein
MASNPRTQNTAAVPEQAPTVASAPATPAEIPFAGAPLGDGQQAEEVTLAHHLAIRGKDYVPGSRIRVNPDYARQLRSNGYAAREARR